MNATNAADQVLRTLKGHTKSITTLEIVNLDGKQTIISASHDGLIIAWNAQNGQMNSIENSKLQHTNQVQSVAYNANDKTIVTCALDDSLKFIDATKMEYM